MENKIFISYSSKQEKEANEICAFLEKKGVACWITSRDIDPGRDYPKQIVQAIRACPAFILVASEDTNISEHVCNEVSMAFDEKKFIIPFKLQNITFTDTYLYYIGRKQQINAYAGFLDALEMLYHSLIENQLENDKTEKDASDEDALNVFYALKIDKTYVANNFDQIYINALNSDFYCQMCIGFCYQVGFHTVKSPESARAMYELAINNLKINDDDSKYEKFILIIYYNLAVIFEESGNYDIANELYDHVFRQVQLYYDEIDRGEDYLYCGFRAALKGCLLLRERALCFPSADMMINLNLNAVESIIDGVIDMKVKGKRLNTLRKEICIVGLENARNIYTLRKAAYIMQSNKYKQLNKDENFLNDKYLKRFETLQVYTNQMEILSAEKKIEEIKKEIKRIESREVPSEKFNV